MVTETPTWITTIQRLQTEITFFVLLGIVLYYQLIRSDARILGAIIILTMWGVAGYFYSTQGISTKNSKKTNNTSTKVDFDKELRDRNREGITTSNYYLKQFTDKALFLEKNKTLIKIADDLAFVRMFEKSRYQDLILHLDRFQKVYMYVLAGRYHSVSYLNTFQDLSDGILEILYSLYFVVPDKLRHVYGVDTYATIENSISKFTAISRKMTTILEQFSKREQGNVVNSNLPRPAPKQTHSLP